MNLITLGWSGLIGCAGACGALARHFVGRFISTRVNASFPWATLLINISGALLIGLISGLVTKHLVSAQAQSVLATGFLGGYTTFSTMSWESVQLARGGNRRQAILYLGSTFVPGLIAAAVGLLLGGLV